VDIHRRVGAATLYVTHDHAEALTMADRVAVMLGGEIVQVGTPTEIYENPTDLRVASFIGSPRINLLPAHVGEDGVVRLQGAATGLVSTARGKLTLAIRPEALEPAHCGWPALVEHTEYLGESTPLHARLDATPVVLRGPAAHSFAPGQPVTLRFDPARALLFGEDGRRLPAHEPQHA